MHYLPRAIIAAIFAGALALTASAKTIRYSFDNAVKNNQMILVGELRGRAGNVHTVSVLRAFRGFPPRSLKLTLSAKRYSMNRKYLFFLGGRPGAWRLFEWTNANLEVDGRKLKLSQTSMQWGGVMLDRAPTTFEGVAARVHALAPVAEWSTRAFGRAMLAAGDRRPLTDAERRAIDASIAGLSARRWADRESAQRALAGLRQPGVEHLRKARATATDPEQRQRLAQAIRGYSLMDKARPLADDLTSVRRWANHPDKALRERFRDRVKELQK